MNYYERHIGDYIRDTVSLSMLEDGAYNRLIDQCYQTEKPLPLDKKMIYRLARATTAAERKAVDFVVEAFFVRTEEGYVQKRIQEEIEKYQAKNEDKAGRRENEKERQRRHRERRKQLFEALREYGEVPHYDTPTEELVTLMSRVTDRDKQRDRHAYVTLDATANQTPDTRHQLTLDTSSHTSTSVGAPEKPPETIPERNVQIAIFLRKLKVEATSIHPVVCEEWAKNTMVTNEILELAVLKAREAKPTERIPVNYLKPIVEQLLNPPEAKPKPAADTWWTSHAGIDRKGREIGLTAKPTEDYGSYKDRIFEAIRQQGGKAP